VPLSIEPDLGALVLLSGPEGGLSTGEETRARAGGFKPRSLGPRVLRADTAPLAALSRLA
jgi:16S rRNA (uracil1498-N3)-methyltransferase